MINGLEFGDKKNKLLKMYESLFGNDIKGGYTCSERFININEMLTRNFKINKIKDEIHYNISNTYKFRQQIECVAPACSVSFKNWWRDIGNKNPLGIQFIDDKRHQNFDELLIYIEKMVEYNIKTNPRWKQSWEKFLTDIIIVLKEGEYLLTFNEEKDRKIPGMFHSLVEKI